MFDPFLAFLVAALVVARMSLSMDPGPDPACPSDMRLVSGTHYDELLHYCVAPRRDAKDTHCFAYWEDVSGEEGAATNIRVCMDQFEAPNTRGARPLVMQSYKTAKQWCARRNKRVCTEQEWEFACEGRDHRALSYGWHVDVALCNSGKTWRSYDAAKLYGDDADSQKEVERLWQGAPSGSFDRCVSPFGIYDMNGNVEEWVTSRKRRKYPGALMGGFWAKPWTGCRGTNDAHEPKFKFYETGFRCCMSPRD
jgi:formylglycine-generating enzyme required for sulfatase activity